MGKGREVESGAVRLPEHLDVALRGALPCIVCGYDLKGLSVRGVCPECGTAVRAAILYQVDPRAEEFAPVRAPAITGLALILWPLGALIVMFAGWAMRLTDLAGTQMNLRVGIGWGGALVAAGVVVSAIGALGLVDPTRATRKWGVIAAALGVLCYAPIYFALDRILRIDATLIPYIESGAVRERSVARLVVDIALIGVLLGLRPNARELVRRSLAMRTGRVDRQTLLAMVGAVFVAMAGDILHLLATGPGAPMEEVFVVVGTLLIAVASVFLTIGAISAMIDGVRIRRAVIHPPMSIEELLGTDPSRPG